jgi:predicted MPP superfamily phosphohydrolase
MILFTFSSLALLGALLFVYMHKVAPYQFQVNRHDVTLRKKTAKPFSVLHLSDIHFTGPCPALERFFEKLSQETYDLIVLTGDIIDCETGIASAVNLLPQLKSRYGFFAVFGNHDYYDYQLKDACFHNFPGQSKPKKLNPAEELKTALEGAGIVVLRNQTREIDMNGAALLIHGLDDPTTGRASIRKTLENYDAAKINLLLTHSIDAFYDIGEDEIDLSFSGHSHGGQVRLPALGPIVTHTTMGRAYASGILKLKGAACSISRGIGFGRVLPFRLLCPPEAIILTVAGV